MELPEITSHKELSLRILQLKSEKLKEELELKESIRDLVDSIDPVTLIKNSVLKIGKDKEVKTGLAAMAMNLGVNYLIEKVLGRNKNIKGYLGSALVENISTSIINNNAPKILSFISKLLNNKTDQDTNT